MLMTFIITITYTLELDIQYFYDILQTSYKPGEYIVRQGAYGDTFFIISQGRVRNKLL